MGSSEIDTGRWERKEVLGRGGFGQVTLWVNKQTGERLAIKKLHETILNDATSKKQAGRWCKEVEIMNKLNHKNIVSTLEVPEELKKTSPLPVLAMEYCTLGNLRQELNRPENCCGLEEYEVINVLKDISSALAYLHSRKIIHRDLKPENIVLQENVECQDITVYKLIDLGYAKSLDQSSLSQSFVGTIQYIAPELFMGKPYTSSVDYWSLGLLTHEIITGFRPFMPGFNPMDWMKHIENKARDVICVMEEENGDITFSSTISGKNHLSRSFLKHIEKWLQLALDWDGKTRGREPENNRLVIFDELANVLCKKVIKIFSLPTYETLSYEINAETDATELKRWLKEDTNLEEDNQLLILLDGKELNSSDKLLTTLKPENFNRKEISMFLYHSRPVKLKPYEEVKPKFVETLLQSGVKRVKYRHLKRICADAIYLCQFESDRYNNFLVGLDIKILNTRMKTLTVEYVYEDFIDLWTQVETYSHFFSLSHKVDLDNYIYYRKNGKLEDCVLIRKWIRNAVEMENRVIELKKSFVMPDERQIMLMAKERYMALQNNTVGPCNHKTPLDEIAKKGFELWTFLQRSFKEEQNKKITNAKVIQMVKKCVEEATKLLEILMPNSLCLKTAEIDESQVKFFSRLKTFLGNGETLKEAIENAQKERQKEVWDLIGRVKVESGESGKVNGKVEEVEEKKIDSKNGIEQINGNVVFKSASPNTSALSVDDIAPKNSNCKETESGWTLQSDLDLNSTDFNDASSIINDNYKLRYRIQDVEQSFHQMIKEIRSLKWDFIEEV